MQFLLVNDPREWQAECSEDEENTDGDEAKSELKNDSEVINYVISEDHEDAKGGEMFDITR